MKQLLSNRRGGEHIVFGSDLAGTGVTVSCVHDIIIMSQLAKFNQIWMDITLGHHEKLIRFLWLWPNFQGHFRT